MSKIVPSIIINFVGCVDGTVAMLKEGEENKEKAKGRKASSYIKDLY